MLLSITTEGEDADDFSYLLHKHPERFQSFELSFGTAHVFYSELSAQRSTACLVLDIDPVEMVRSHRQRGNYSIEGYVNDRPFVASSFLSTALVGVFGSAMAGRCQDRPAAVDQLRELTVRIEALPVKGGPTFLRSLFEPLGYEVDVESSLLDERFATWGDSPYLTVTLKAKLTVSSMLNHLYVLIPVFDNQKHYFVGRDEIDKLLSKGEGWLSTHPAREAISRRYLRHQPGFVRQALARLDEQVAVAEVAAEDEGEKSLTETQSQTPTETLSKNQTQTETTPKSMAEATTETLNVRRHKRVVETLLELGAKRVVDLGCGEGKLLQRLLAHKLFEQILGMDVSIRSLEIAAARLRLESLPSFQADRIRLIHGSLMYRDKRLSGFDAATLIEVIEHLDPPRLVALERVVFEHARPKHIVLTTPNAEYNVVWEALPAGNFRHSDHRFEWTRPQFQAWADRLATRFEYQVRFAGIGDEVDNVGSPTQMAIFSQS